MPTDQSLCDGPVCQENSLLCTLDWRHEVVQFILAFHLFMLFMISGAAMYESVKR